MFMCAFLLLMGVHSVSAQVSLTTNQTDLKTVIQRIKSKTKYRFFYDDALGKQTINAVSISNLPIDFVLNRLFENTGITYKIIDNIIYLKKVKPVVQSTEATGSETNLQQRKPEQSITPVLYTFNGQVQDVSGHSLIGATIIVKGSSKARAMTDLEGKFVLKSETPNPVLIISCIGYDAIEKRIENRHNQLFVLKESLYELEDVFVTALGINRSRTALNYNVKQMNGEDLNKVKTTNFANALVGRAAGISVNESAAGMGGAARVVMRGPKSLAQSNQPLYVIDGIPINNRSNDDIKGGIYSLQPGAEGISDINPDDVESVSVLSGAAAAALYGSAAAQGAVMIKTKSGRAGKTSVEFSTSTQFLSPFVLPEFQNEYGNRTNEMKSWGTKNASGTGSYTPNDLRIMRQ